MAKPNDAIVRALAEICTLQVGAFAEELGETKRLNFALDWAKPEHRSSIIQCQIKPALYQRTSRRHGYARIARDGSPMEMGIIPCLLDDKRLRPVLIEVFLHEVVHLCIESRFVGEHHGPMWRRGMTLLGLRPSPYTLDHHSTLISASHRAQSAQSKKGPNK